MDKTAHLDVQGMTCSSCASGIGKHLEKLGVKEVRVYFDSGELEALLPEGWDESRLIAEIERLGYSGNVKGGQTPEKSFFDKLQSLEFRFVLSALFTIPLLAHMLSPWTVLHSAIVQFFLCLPVMLIGWQHFGKSAIGALRSGIPNMDVLISLGSGSAFIYSLLSWFGSSGEHHGDLYFETAASIITLLLLGNLIERRSLRSTQKGLSDLIRLQPLKASRLVNAMTNNERTEDVEASALRPNDLVLVQSGSRIPADGQVYEGEARIDTSMMTGEAMPRKCVPNDAVLSGTIVSEGYIKFIVKQSGTETTLSRMIDVIRNAAMRKPQIQRFGDRISAVFVPVVIGIALITFLLSWLWFGYDSGESLLRAIAVLVISCPCAMGLATPTAVAVAIGHAARNGILIKGGDTLERLNGVSTLVFDKTGTLTEGKMKLESLEADSDPKLVKALLGTLEQYSTHPYARTLAAEFSQETLPAEIRFKEIREVKGQGIEAKTVDGKLIRLGSARFTGAEQDPTFQVFLSFNQVIIGRARFSDPPREEATEVVRRCREMGMRIVLLSGDRQSACSSLAAKLGIDEVYAEQLPDDKFNRIQLLRKNGPVAMIGDGINDAAAMAIADVGIAVGQGSSIAIQTAEIVLLNNQPIGLLPELLTLSTRSIRTIRQNLLWALAYNLVAIPMAAAGYLSPLLASLSMAFSDVVVIGNSLLLHVRHRFTRQ
ncbi:MAG: cadmium-translocating P-type ATPase [Sphingobacteriales bacterium]|nr:cadmium-translocating P-type ATPase [Sphingobacteriales bacterium]